MRFKKGLSAKKIIQGGKVVGWKLYKKGGYFNTDSFVGYKWRKLNVGESKRMIEKGKNIIVKRIC